MTDDRSLASLSAQDFQAQVGTRFAMAAEAVDPELIEVTELGVRGSDGRRSPFSLVFRGPLHPSLPQGIRRVEHTELGRLDLFLVPIGPDEAGMRYEAVFG